MRLEGDCVETWPQGMVMSGSGAARVEILRSAWVLCDYLQRRNVQTDLKECPHTSPSLPHVWNITSCFLAPFLHCIAIAVVDNEGGTLKPDCEPRLGGGIWRNIELNLSFNWKMFSKVVFLS